MVPEIDWLRYCNYGVVANVYRAFRATAKHCPQEPWGKAVTEFDTLQQTLKTFFRTKLESAAYACVIAPSVALDKETNLVKRPRSRSGACFDETVSKLITSARKIIKYDPAKGIWDKRHETKESFLYATYAAHKQATYNDAKDFRLLFDRTFAVLDDKEKAKKN